MSKLDDVFASLGSTLVASIEKSAKPGDGKGEPITLEDLHKQVGELSTQVTALSALLSPKEGEKGELVKSVESNETDIETLHKAISDDNGIIARLERVESHLSGQRSVRKSASSGEEEEDISKSKGGKFDALLTGLARAPGSRARLT